MNLEHYRNFITIVETGTISGAAEKLHITQPALSNQIKNLEREYGAPLLTRGSRRVELTDAGRIMYSRAKSIAELENSARREISDCTAGSAGTLRLAFTPAYPDTLLTSLLLDFRREYPGVVYEIFEQNSGQIMELLKSGVVEIGIIRTPERIPEYLTSLMTFGEHLMAYYHRENRYFSPDDRLIDIQALQGVPISISRGFREKFDQMCRRREFDPSYVCVSSSRNAACVFAEDRQTVAIVIGSKSFDEGSFCCRPLSGDAFNTYRTFAAAKGVPLSAAARNFVSFCMARDGFDAWAKEQKIADL